jgi:hypothetical protein
VTDVWSLERQLLDEEDAAIVAARELIAARKRLMAQQAAFIDALVDIERKLKVLNLKEMLQAEICAVLRTRRRALQLELPDHG